MCTSDLVVGLSNGQKLSNISILLELSAADDLEGFRLVVDEEGYDVDDSGLWYGRSIGSKKMSLEERTPLMIASMFASKQVLKFILGLNRVDVNKACGSDRATALHMAVSGGSSSSIEVVKLLIDASADTSCLDVNGNRPIDLIPLVFGSSFNSKRKFLELMLNGYAHGEELCLRDPQKYHYSCVPCPEFRKGSCRHGDACEYAHGIFECWLHPAQYRTRLCKDEVGCSRKVCFFAHKTEELRPLHPSTGSAVLSPRPMSLKLSDMSSISPFSLGSPSIMIPPSSTPPITPGASSPGGGPLWLNQPSPTLKVLGSRFKTTPNSQDLDFEAEMIRVDRYRQQQLMDEFAGLSPPSSWNNNGFLGDRSEDYNISTGSNHKSLELLSSADHTILSQLQGVSLESRIAQLHQNMNYSGLPSSPLRMSSPSSLRPNQIMHSRSAAFAKRSQSFIDRGTVNRQSGFPSPVLSSMAPSMHSDWGSPDGKLNWGIQKDELNKLRKSASFGVRRSPDSLLIPNNQEPDSHVNNVTFDEEQFPPWVEQLYMEQEQLVA
ncbi:Ankyrin repeat-containing protein [Cynara cardunculus var. scolymus]|uniref:Ankyrin repeat-containing protein n=1 Tax=Cynara cardunculus var. scolymus TaxID=59895 RepID=A0A103XNL8_CYNCS|nr:Ankyrin repeat-containing protein [Cynara cardunculus var. scolymus]